MYQIFEMGENWFFVGGIWYGGTLNRKCWKMGDNMPLHGINFVFLQKIKIELWTNSKALFIILRPAESSPFLFNFRPMAQLYEHNCFTSKWSWRFSLKGTEGKWKLTTRAHSIMKSWANGIWLLSFFPYIWSNMKVANVKLVLNPQLLLMAAQFVSRNNVQEVRFII